MDKMYIPVKISDRALEEVKSIMKAKRIPSGYGLRIGVQGAGCGGTSYLVGFDKKKQEDIEFLQNDITIYVERKHVLYLAGIKLDYYEGKDAKGFTFLTKEEEKNFDQTRN